MKLTQSQFREFEKEATYYREFINSRKDSENKCTFSDDEKRDIMNFIERSRENGIKLGTLTSMVGINRRWHTKWLQQFKRKQFV